MWCILMLTKIITNDKTISTKSDCGRAFIKIRNGKLFILSIVPINATSKQDNKLINGEFKFQHHDVNYLYFVCGVIDDIMRELVHNDDNSTKESGTRYIVVETRHIQLKWSGYGATEATLCDNKLSRLEINYQGSTGEFVLENYKQSVSYLNFMQKIIIKAISVIEGISVPDVNDIRIRMKEEEDKNAHNME